MGTSLIFIIMFPMMILLHIIQSEIFTGQKTHRRNGYHKPISVVFFCVYFIGILISAKEDVE